MCSELKQKCKSRIKICEPTTARVILGPRRQPAVWYTERMFVEVEALNDFVVKVTGVVLSYFSVISIWL